MSINKAGTYGVWVFPLLAFLILRFGFGFNGLYGQDGHEYLRYTREVLAFFQGAPVESNFFWPVGYSLFGALLAYPLRSPELALLLISVMSLSVTGWLTLLMLERLYPARKFPKFLFVLLFLVISPFMMRGGLVVMSDMLATWFLMGAFVAFLRLTESLSFRWFLVFVMSAAFAVLTRYPVAFLLVLPTLWVLFYCLKNGKVYWLFAGAILGGLCLLPHFWLRTGNTWLPQHMELDWSVNNFFQSSFQSTEGFRQYRLPNLLYAFGNFFHPGYLFAGLFLLPFVRLRDMKGVFFKITVAGILIYAIFLAGMAYQNQRFLIISFPLVLLILYPAFSSVWESYCPKWMKNLVWVGIVIIQIGLFAYAMKPIVERNQLERNMVKIVQKYQPKVLYTFDIDLALKSYRVASEVKSLWVTRYEDFEDGASVLFNEPAFSKQWQGHNLMFNWEKLNEAYNLKLQEEIGAGWILYRIEGEKKQEKQ